MLMVLLIFNFVFVRSLVMTLLKMKSINEFYEKWDELRVIIF